MTSLSLHDSDRQSETREALSPLALLTELILPSAGARVVTSIGPTPERLLCRVLLAPGSGLSKRDREQIVAAHSLVFCSIRSEAAFPWRLPPRPADFHHSTLQWMLRSADNVFVWSAPYPSFSDAYTAARVKAVSGGAGFIATVECASDNVAEWVRLVRLSKRKSTEVTIFGPEDSVASTSDAVASAGGRRA